MEVETRTAPVLGGGVVYTEERPIPWYVNWSGIWTGALAALATALVIGLVAVAVGAHVLNDKPWVEAKDLRFWTAAFAIVGAFFSFVVGGWVAGKITGARRSETTMLHGAITWLVALPLLMVLGTLGAANYMGGWYGGMSGRPAWAPAQTKTVEAAVSGDNSTNADPAAERVTRNNALCAVTALLLGLVGSVIGGWMASGEPMTFTHHRTRMRTDTTHSTHTAMGTRP